MCVVVVLLLFVVRSLSLSPDLSADSLSRSVALVHTRSLHRLRPRPQRASSRTPSIVAGPRPRAALADPLPRTAPPPDCRPSASPSRPKRSAPRPSLHSLHCGALRHSALGTCAHARLDARPNATQRHSSLLSPFLYPPRPTNPETHHNAPPPRPPLSLSPSSSLERLRFLCSPRPRSPLAPCLTRNSNSTLLPACLPACPRRVRCAVET